jgi:hypothetical protein
MISNLLEKQAVSQGNSQRPAAAFFCDTPGCRPTVKLLVDAPN